MRTMARLLLFYDYSVFWHGHCIWPVRRWFSISSPIIVEFLFFVFNWRTRCRMRAVDRIYDHSSESYQLIAIFSPLKWLNWSVPKTECSDDASEYNYHSLKSIKFTIMCIKVKMSFVSSSPKNVSKNFHSKRITWLHSDYVNYYNMISLNIICSKWNSVA